MKRIIRDSPVSPEESAKYNKIREQVAQELPYLIARHHQRQKIGKTRIKLAALLNNLFPFLDVKPEDLISQTPFYSRPEMDACTWYANVNYKPTKGTRYSIACWDTMKDCVQHGIEIVNKNEIRADVIASVIAKPHGK